MKHSGFSISTHLFELFDKGFVLNCRLSGVSLTFRLGLCGIRRYRIRVALQLFFDLSLQHCTKRVFIWAI
ncbi:hypothetical protein PS710_03149 [Pseudomonas fluorescens]|uniref:Uncharacterized protein n=1 Tax=Pseudomonas fluorescens TaxID=294 RepID=A0A5E7CPX6_PSEFL|nr:hypothetical protein PS639_00699 [Pseudomonas fluorescens]VVO07113.1 hypothetical protein PS710_03149 [Pseudomonas fluorescens]VVQ25824.1 hypothetical protein PS928_06214 [Pseudomonas fluorescens]